MIEITKASGEKVPFEAEKLRRSLQRVGADEELIEQIVTEIKAALKPGMSTHAIYKIAFRLLRQKARTSAAKYHLKRAIMHLGVSGYPFEKYFAALLQHRGYKTLNDQIINGYCISHEVDVVARKENTEIIVECKYHHLQGLKCNVTVALYIKARFLDIEQARKNSLMNMECWLVTNTRFTTDAMKYGRCAKLHLIAWDYPEKDSLKEMIEDARLYPITCITNLTKAELMRLVENNVVLCKTIRDDPKILDRLNLSPGRKNSVIQQCQKICEL